MMTRELYLRRKGLLEQAEKYFGLANGARPRSSRYHQCCARAREFYKQAEAIWPIGQKMPR